MEFTGKGNQCGATFPDIQGSPVRVRPFETGDIQTVVQLRARCFGSTGQATPQLAEARFCKVLFDNPWYRRDICSLVAEDERGAIVGFLGAVPRPMSFQGSPVCMGVVSQLMVDPAARGLKTGAALLTEFGKGGQDLSCADLANDSFRRVWQEVGSPVAALYSLYWVLPVRPARYALSVCSDYGVPLNTIRALRPFAAAADVYLARGASGNDWMNRKTSASVDIDAQRVLALYETTLQRHAIRPLYSLADLHWLIADLQAQLPDRQLLRVREVPDGDGHPLGWYMYCVQSGGAAQVIQFGSVSEEPDSVLAALCRDAHLDGAVYVAGRVQPKYLPQLGEAKVHLYRRGPWVCFDAKRPELKSAILEGNAWLTRLEGEWWMNF